MKLPWVSRESAERLIAYHEQNAEGWKELFRIEAAKTHALNERILSLKMTGAVEPPVQPIGRDAAGQVTPNSLHGAKSDELRDLIDVKAGGDLRRRSMMLAQLKRDRADGVSEEAIERQIRDGVQSEGVPS